VTNALGGSILLTGGAGFLGRVVRAELDRRGSGPVTAPRRSDIDLTDQGAVMDLMNRVRPDLVIHLAAEVGGIGANRTNPGRYFYANMAMGLHLIEASRQAGVGKFVQVGTVCSYPKLTPVPFREEHLWNGYPEETNAPYGIAKKSLLVMLQAYRAQYGFNGIFLLPANLYGPGDNFDPATSHVIPALIRRFVEARQGAASEVVLWGTGSPSREFLYVEDAARGIVDAAARYNEADPVNLGTGHEITIADLAAVVARLTGFEGNVSFDPSFPDGQPRRSLDVSQARDRFGFEASIPLEQGLQDTIAWWEAQG
jgi:GDP-L-fucose synthase